MKYHEIAYSRSQVAMGSKTTIPKLMKFITKHPWVQVLKKEKRNETIWSLHVEIIQIWIHILYNSVQFWRVDSIFCKWNHLSIQKSEAWFHDQMIHRVDFKNIYTIEGSLEV